MTSKILILSLCILISSFILYSPGQAEQKSDIFIPWDYLTLPRDMAKYQNVLKRIFFNKQYSILTMLYLPVSKNEWIVKVENINSEVMEAVVIESKKRIWDTLLQSGFSDEIIEKTNWDISISKKEINKKLVNKIFKIWKTNLEGVYPLNDSLKMLDTDILYFSCWENKIGYYSGMNYSVAPHSNAAKMVQIGLKLKEYVLSNEKKKSKILSELELLAQ
ncbi:MAG: hypothetical protein HQL25_06550 [Candidatus Omnitrophica bacterium]|nr:hypothetical protein [Candidatus Omnitrophota bacterium]